MLHIYNVITKKKELFTPLAPPKVSLYVCGMTVYDYCHIGHGRLFTVFDMVKRYLRSHGYAVTYVRNITDIDDKIIRRAIENGESIEALTTRFIDAMREDEHALNILPPDIEPKATQFIPHIIAMIQTLMDKGIAYIASNGDVCYDVHRFKQYGKFSRQSLGKLRRGARIDLLEGKKDPLDFVLWKLAKPGEPTWDSPWGKGRPGWHIECSAMSAACLGKSIDIHGGGLDLVFPHHQNEIAQSEAAFNTTFVNNWMHVGHVQVDAEKMSKSLNNFSLIRDVTAQFDNEIVRYFMLASHYRNPINYSKENLESAKVGLERLYISLRGLPSVETTSSNDVFMTRFNEAMDDDFNTPVALSVLFDIAREINKLRDENKLIQAAELGNILKKLAGIIGILQKNADDFLQAGITEADMKKIEQLTDARNEARKNKDWDSADKIRQELLSLGVVLEDTTEGTIVRRA